MTVSHKSIKTVIISITIVLSIIVINGISNTLTTVTSDSSSNSNYDTCIRVGKAC